MNRGKPSKRQLRRMEILKREVGCVACKIDGLPTTWADFHHAYNKPASMHAHDWGYPLCPWHHRGHGAGSGVSIAQGKRAFNEMYGSEAVLVAYASRLADEFERNTIGRAV